MTRISITKNYEKKSPLWEREKTVSLVKSWKWEKGRTKNQIKILIKETQGNFIIFFQMINIMVKIITVISIYH